VCVCVCVCVCVLCTRTHMCADVVVSARAGFKEVITAGHDKNSGIKRPPPRQIRARGPDPKPEP